MSLPDPEIQVTDFANHTVGSFLAAGPRGDGA